MIRKPHLNTENYLFIMGRHPVVMDVPDVWIDSYPWSVAAGRRISFGRICRQTLI